MPVAATEGTAEVPVQMRILGLMMAITFLPGSVVPERDWDAVEVGVERGLVAHMLHTRDRMQTVVASEKGYVIMHQGVMAIATTSIVMLTDKGKALLEGLMRKMAE